MKKNLLAFFLFFYSCSFSQTKTSLCSANYMEWHFKGIASGERRVPDIYRITRPLLLPNDRFHEKQGRVDLSNLTEKEGLTFIGQVCNWIRNASHSLHKPGVRNTLFTDASASYAGWLCQNGFVTTHISKANQFTYQTLEFFLNHGAGDT
jgi:hypothetical protein